MPNGFTQFCFAWAIAASLLAIAEFRGDLVPQYCVHAQLDTDYVTAITEARKR